MPETEVLEITVVNPMTVTTLITQMATEITIIRKLQAEIKLESVDLLK